MINNVTLIGRLTRDAELRYTPSNIATAQFNIACNRNFKNTNGEYDADFINCVMWREQAERFCNWTKKGMLVGITGRIQTRSYEGNDGKRVYVTEVVAENFQVLEKRDNTANQNSMTQQMPPNYANPMDIDESDLPF
jgi:single-strand DNA-binding protein